MQPVLRPPTDGPHLMGLSLLASAQFLTHLGRGRVMLGAFHQQPARMGIATLGDAPLAPFVTRSIFRRDQAQIGHHLTWMRKAMHELFKRMSEVMMRRLQAARVKLSEFMQKKTS